MNGHFNLCHDCDFKKLYTEISSLNRIFHEKAASTGSRDSFHDFERHCSKTALDEKKCGFPAVALKILKTCMGACRNRRLTMFLSLLKDFSIEDRV